MWPMTACASACWPLVSTRPRFGGQLRMPVTAAAEFASKMQDATQPAEGDMMGLMDTIQRAYYLTECTRVHSLGRARLLQI